MKIAGTLLGMLVVAPLLALLPVAAAVQLSKDESLRSQTDNLRHLAADLARRANSTGEQFQTARDQLNSGKYGSPGSPGDIQRMRFLTLSSTYVQAVGRMTGTKVTCSSMGVLNSPVDLGAPDITTIRNVHIWLNIKPQFAGGAVFHALESDGCVVFIIPDLMFDIFTSEQSLSMAVATGASKKILTVHGSVSTSWIDRLGSKKSTSFVDGASIVALERCESYDVVAIVAMPIDQAFRKTAGLSIFFLAMGGSIGIATAIFGVKSVSRMGSLPYQLRSAIKKRQLYLLFQPIVSLSTGQVIGAEALLRWRRDNREQTPPDEFIPVAEKLNLIGQVTDQVIEMAFLAAKKSLVAAPGLYIGMNVTSSDVRSGLLPTRLKAASDTHGVPLSQIGIEITETGLLSGIEDQTAFDAIRATGVRVAMDDFGTGYSSLAYLMKLDVDVLKIDRVFVEAIGTDSATSNVIDHMIRMASELGKHIIAEGVETEVQASYLRERGVRYGQGFYFGKPMTLEELLTLVGRGDPASV